MIYYYERFNKTQNNIVTLKNSNIALQNNIIKHKKIVTHKTMLSQHTTQDCNIKNDIVTL